MSLVLQDRIFKRGHKNLKHYETWVLRYMALRGAKEYNGFIYNIYPAIPTIADYCMCGRRSVERAIQNLLKEGIIIYVRTHSNGNKEYKINLTVLEAFLMPKHTSDRQEDATVNHEKTTVENVDASDRREDASDSRTILYDPLNISTSTSTVNNNLEEQIKTDDIEELYLLSNKYADKNDLHIHLKTYKTPLKHLVNAINIVNSLKLEEAQYNKYLSVAIFKLYKESLPENEVVEIITNRITKKYSKTKDFHCAPMTNVRIDELIMFGRNYNNNFTEPYVISKNYAFAAEALRQAGVSFEMR